MKVLTRNSLYIFDLANKTVTRVMITGYEMRRDNEVMRLLDMNIPVVGKPLSMILDLQLPGVPSTWRISSNVLEIL